MTTVVSIRATPDLEQLSVSQSQGRVFERGKRKLHPDSALAVESALQKREGEIVAVLVGARADEDAVKPALAMGCDRAVIVTEESESWDGFVRANLLQAVMTRAGADLLMAGPKDEAALRIGAETAAADLNPRLPNALAIMKAGRKPIERLSPDDLGLPEDDLKPRYVVRGSYLS